MPTTINTTPLETRIKNLASLFERYSPVPDSWYESPEGEDNNKPRKVSGKDLACIPCDNYRELINAWRKALKWTDGLDHALGAMLAAVTSTKQNGDQLWLKIVGPAACLGAGTLVYDPVNKTNKTVEQRCREGKRFWVYTMKKEGLGIAQALPPKQFQKQAMYRVTFQSGREIHVTGGHQFWNGTSYVPLHNVVDELHLSSAYHLPTISGTALLARQQDAQRLKKTIGDSLSCCHLSSCSYGEPLRQVKDTCQCVSPSQDGALVCSQHATYEDGLEEPSRKHTCQACELDPLSNLDSPPSSQYHPRQGEVAHQLDVNACDKSLYSPTWLLHNQRETYHLGTYQPGLECSLHTSDTSVQCCSPLGIGQLVSFQYGTYSDIDLGYALQDSKQLKLGDASPLLPQKGDASQVGETLHHTYSMPSVRDAVQYVVPSESLQKRGQTCTIEQLPSNALQKQVSCLTSVGIDRTHLGLSILTETDEITKIEYVGEEYYYDFSVPETQNYWAEGFFHHNCGKSTLCEALSINPDYVLAKSTIRGFHSGFRTEGGNDGEDHSLMAIINGKTLVTKDGDTLLQSPNLGQILSEARDVYDCVSRTHYRNAMSKDYQGIRMTWLLCGTSSLRQLDASELGERFLDCVIMEGIDDDLEDEILWRVVNRADRNIVLEANGKPETQYEPDLAYAMQLTGGYVSHLRENATNILTEIECPEWAKRKLTRLGKFTAYMRARPSTRQDETAEREFATRLVSQLTRLAFCLAAVLNQKVINAKVMKRVAKVAMDTSRGQTLMIASLLYDAGSEGLDIRAVTLHLSTTSDKSGKLIRFLKLIGVVEAFTTNPGKGVIGARPRYRLTSRIHRLYTEVMNEGTALEE